MTLYRIAEEFTPDLGGRYYTDGDYSGQEFRERHLIDLVTEAMRTGEVLRINFDGCTGMPPSFVEEAFGGLARAKPEWAVADIARVVQLEAPASPKFWHWVKFGENAILRGRDRPPGR